MAITLNSNSAVTLEEHRVFTGTPYSKADADWSGSASLRLNMAMDTIETFCGRTFIPSTTTSEVFNGDGFNYQYNIIHTEYATKQAPISGSITLYEYADTDGWTEMDETVLYTEGEFIDGGGLIYFPSISGNYFEDGVQNYKVSYAYGYTQDTVPAAIKAAQSHFAQFLAMQGEHAGIKTHTQGDRGTTYNTELPAFMKTLLSRYAR